MPLNKYVSLNNIAGMLLDAVCVVDREGRYVYVGAAFERIFGYKPEEVIGKPMIELVAPEDREITLQAAMRIMAGFPNPHFENRYIRKDGKVVHIQWSARWSESDEVRVAIAHDITARKQAEAKQQVLYAISEAAHRADNLPDLFRQIHQIIGATLPADNFTVVLRDKRNGTLSMPYHVDLGEAAPEQARAAAENFGRDVIRFGQPLLITPDTISTHQGELTALQARQCLYWLGVPLHSKDGITGALILQSGVRNRQYTEDDKEFLHFVSNQIATAVERQQLLAQLQQMAQYDELTGLANRRLLQDRLRMALARARREGGGFSLLYLDLDKFKEVNDTFGHATGDLLLQVVAQRLRQSVRESDTVARIGGDEFLVLLEHNGESAHAAVVAEKIRGALGLPLPIAGLSLTIRQSIGIAHYPDHGDTEEQLLKHADSAMYREKLSGG